MLLGFDYLPFHNVLETDVDVREPVIIPQVLFTLGSVTIPTEDLVERTQHRPSYGVIGVHQECQPTSLFREVLVT